MPSLAPHLLPAIIDDAFEQLADWSPQTAPPDLKEAVHAALQLLDGGQKRVCQHRDSQWVVEEWLKKAILLSFRLYENHVMDDGHTHYYDKIPGKYQHATQDDFEQTRARVVPPAYVRWGAHIAPNVVLMPSFVNIGAYVGAGTLVDTWATIGSCAQIGENVHISGGTGIGGVLEPLQSTPTIVEDNCFIGARSEVVEGVVVGQGSVIGMGVFIGQSTKIYNRLTQEVTHGYVPPYSVVVPGTLPAQDGSHHLYAAIIVKQVDENTRRKVSINELLRP